jgi:hypothetical protein
MDIRTRAALYTVAFFAICVGFSFGLIWATEVLPGYVFAYAGAGIIFAGLLYMVYQLMLMKLQHDESLENLSKKYYESE